MPPLQAQCLCGAVQIAGTLPSLWLAHCHCTQCQRAHGAAFVTWIGMRADGCEVHDPEYLLHWYASSPGAERGFCSRCGSSLAFRSTRWPGELHLTVANLTGAPDREPQAHVFWDTHVDWVQLAEDGLPRKSASEISASS
jgi:hypothetical protein